MQTTRRDALTSGALALLGGGFLSRVYKVAGMQSGGAGVEGHQPPYIALGDYTMLRKNMCFSEEPGLYDPENGCGFNWSNTIVVAKKSGYRMSFVPYSKEWCWLKL